MCFAAASGRLTVEVVPSRTTAVLLTPAQVIPVSVLQTRDSCFGETTMVASCPWWRMLAGGVSGGGEASLSRASMLQIVWVADTVFREKSLLARLTPTRCRLRVASSLPEGRRGYHPSASLCAGGNPRASSLVRAASCALFLQRAAWYLTFRC